MSISIREQERDNALLLRTSHSQLEFSIWEAAFKLLRGDRLLLKSGPGWGEPNISLVHWQVGQLEAVLTYHRGVHGLGRLIVTALDDGWRMAWDQPTRDTFDLESGGHWYGQGAMAAQTWPLERLRQPESEFITWDNSPTGLGNILAPIWITATGVALYVERFSNSLEVGLNGTSPDEPQVPVEVPGDSSAQPVTVTHSGILSLRDKGGALSYALMLGADAPTAYHRFVRRVGRPDRLPPQGLVREPVWTTWASDKLGIDQAAILNYAREIRNHDFPGSTIIIDEQWERRYGDLAFDTTRFPDSSAMIRQINEMGFSVMCWVSPFFEAESTHGKEAVHKQFVIQMPDGTPYLIQWRNGAGYLLDVSNPYALEWWADKLLNIQRDLGISGFRFDSGEASYLPADAITHAPMLRNDFSARYNEFAARRFPYGEVRTAWQNQRGAIGLRQRNKASLWEPETGLASVLTTTLSLSMCGYFFNLADMIGGSSEHGNQPDRELLIRWTQASSLLLSMHFSLPPWKYGAETTEICRRFAQLHVNLADERISAAEEALVTGNPPIRPIFWANPRDTDAQVVADEYMLGDKFLVAPVVHQGMTARDIYLPAGVWRDYWSGATYSGKQWLRAFSAPLEVLPLFIRAV